MTAFLAAWRISQSPGRDALPVWAAVILAYDIGALAVTFNYALFISQGGMEFWLLNAVIFTAAAYQQRAGSNRMKARVG